MTQTYAQPAVSQHAQTFEPVSLPTYQFADSYTQQQPVMQAPVTSYAQPMTQTYAQPYSQPYTDFNVPQSDSSLVSGHAFDPSRAPKSRDGTPIRLRPY